VTQLDFLFLLFFKKHVEILLKQRKEWHGPLTVGKRRSACETGRNSREEVSGWSWNVDESLVGFLEEKMKKERRKSW